MTPHRACSCTVYDPLAGAIRSCQQVATAGTEMVPLCPTHASALMTETREALRAAGLDALPLSPEDWAFLQYMLTRPGRVATFEALAKALVGYEPTGWPRLMAVRVFRLRQQLSLVYGAPARDIIRNARGRGYLWDPDVARTVLPQKERAA